MSPSLFSLKRSKIVDLFLCLFRTLSLYLVPFPFFFFLPLAPMSLPIPCPLHTFLGSPFPSVQLRSLDDLYAGLFAAAARWSPFRTTACKKYVFTLIRCPVFWATNQPGSSQLGAKNRTTIFRVRVRVSVKFRNRYFFCRQLIVGHWVCRPVDWRPDGFNCFQTSRHCNF